MGAGHAFAPGGARPRSADRRKSGGTGPARALVAALAERFGAPANRAESGRLGRAASLLLEANATPEEVGRLADACVQRWGAGYCTPQSIAANVSALRAPPATAASGQERHFPDYRSSAEKAANPRREWRETYAPPAAQERMA